MKLFEKIIIGLFGIGCFTLHFWSYGLSVPKAIPVFALAGISVVILFVFENQIISSYEKNPTKTSIIITLLTGLGVIVSWFIFRYPHL